jgi:Fe2+ transport system protein FeoA
MSPTQTNPGILRLDELAPHVCATVRALDTDDEDVHRLKTLGLCVGRQLEVVKSGDPLIVRIFGSRLGLAARLAARVRVEPCGAGCACPVIVPVKAK